MFFRLFAVAAFAASIGWASVAAAADQPAPSRRVLFFDLWKLDSWENVELRQGEPEWIEEGTYLESADPKRGVHFPTVWRDDETGKWRMIHSLKWSPFTLMACESADGIHWQPLAVPDAKPAGKKLAPHHLFTLDSGAGSAAYDDPKRTGGYRFRIFGRQHGEPVFRRALADPKHRWHEIAKDEGKKRYFSEAVTLVSRDGLDWELKTGGEWDWGQDGWFPEPPVFAFWNERTQRHTMIVRPGWGDRRQCLRTSADLKTWTDPELLLQPDTLDTDGPIGLYGMPVVPVGKGAGYVGLLWIFHNASSEPVTSFNQFFGTMDAQLAFSYDGVRFFRGKREPFLRRNPFPKHGCTQIRPGSIVETDTEIRIYSEGHRGEHGRERGEQSRQNEPLGALILHTLRKDGWMFLRSRGDWARIQTKPFVLFEPEIAVNADASYGEIRFQLTDEKSEPIAGFTFADCKGLQGADGLKQRLEWENGKLESVTDRVLRLEVKFRNANVYSLDMAHHFLDAQDLWLIKDGKTIDRRLFDY